MSSSIFDEISFLFFTGWYIVYVHELENYLHNRDRWFVNVSEWFLSKYFYLNNFFLFRLLTTVQLINLKILRTSLPMYKIHYLVMKLFFFNNNDVLKDPALYCQYFCQLMLDTNHNIQRNAIVLSIWVIIEYKWYDSISTSHFDNKKLNSMMIKNMNQEIKKKKTKLHFIILYPMNLIVETNNALELHLFFVCWSSIIWNDT